MDHAAQASALSQSEQLGDHSTDPTQSHSHTCLITPPRSWPLARLSRTDTLPSNPRAHMTAYI